MILHINPSFVTDTLYNFNLTIGDSVKYKFKDYYVESWIKIIKIDSIEINGNFHKRYFFSEPKEPNAFTFLKEVWIEDIGSIHGPLFPGNAVVFASEWPDSLFLTCFSINDTILWDNPFYDKCFVNIVLEYYKCFQEDAEYYFVNKDKDIKAVRFDSIRQKDDDIYYYNYNTIRKDSIYDCYTAHGASWIGKYFIEKPNGDALFFNTELDTIIIKTSAKVEESWVCFNYKNQDYIEAKISKKDTANFLELTDSIKTISFQRKDKNDNNLDDCINTFTLKLSKRYGFIQLTNFYLFPCIQSDNRDYINYDDFAEYDIIGKTNNISGKINLTYREIFNFNVGDEFHDKSINYSGFPVQIDSDTDTTYTIKKILAKNYIINKKDTDSVAYNIGICSKYIHYYNSQLVKEIKENDTIKETYAIKDSIFDRLPEESQQLDEYRFIKLGMKLTINERRMKTYPVLVLYVNSNFSECLLLNNIDVYDLDDNYIEGSGGPYFDNSYFNNRYAKRLVYYKKGSEEWGTPFNCSVLMDVNNINTLNSTNILEIYPNPASSLITVSYSFIEKSKIKISVYDVMGREQLRIENGELRIEN